VFGGFARIEEVKHYSRLSFAMTPVPRKPVSGRKAFLHTKNAKAKKACAPGFFLSAHMAAVSVIH